MSTQATNDDILSFHRESRAYLQPPMALSRHMCLQKCLYVQLSHVLLYMPLPASAPYSHEKWSGHREAWQLRLAWAREDSIVSILTVANQRFGNQERTRAKTRTPRFLFLLCAICIHESVLPWHLNTDVQVRVSTCSLDSLSQSPSLGA